MRVNTIFIQKRRLFWFAGVLLVAGVWLVAWWMHQTLVSLEERQPVIVSGVVSDIARDGSWLSVGGFYHAADARIFSLSAATITDAQQQQKTIADIRAGFPVRVQGYYLSDHTAVAQNVMLLGEPPIVLYAPAPHDSVSGSVTVSGTARVFENQFLIQLADASGKILAQESAYAHAPDVGQYGDFSLTIAIPSSATGTLLLKAFDLSAKDGSPLGLLEVPITVASSSQDESAIKIFLGKTAENNTDCSRVFPVSRSISATSSVARAALTQLLAGPTDAEKANGYFSSIPDGVRIQKLSISNGTASADFDEVLERAVGGSCRVTSIRAQITQTLLQFPSVHRVIISIDGRTQDILQP